MNEQPLCTIMGPIMELMKTLNVVNIKDLPDAFEYKIDNNWYIADNGHKEELLVNPPETMGANIPPFHFAVWYNGWLIGLFHPYGGIFGDGWGASEEKFTQAVKIHIEELERK